MTETTTKTKEESVEKTKKASVYSTLAKIDVQPYISKKMGLNYLSWAKAWGLVKAIYPDATYKYTEYPEFLPTNDGWLSTGRTVDYRLTTAGCEVEVTVTIAGFSTKEQLYVMDNRNRPVKNPDYGQINKAQKRCLVKALANAGLGLEVYAGEDLPSDETETAQKANKKPRQQTKRNTLAKQPNPAITKYTDEQLKNYIPSFLRNKPKEEQKTLLEIYQGAKAGDNQLQSLWSANFKHPETEDGNAIVQFSQRKDRLTKQGA